MATSSDRDRTVVLVHGAWHSPWCWNRVIGELDRHGIPSVTVDLPSCRDEGAAAGDMHADAAEIRRVLDGHDDAVLVAHSYAGIPATEGAAGHPAVRHLVYVAAYIADEGETLMGYSAPDAGPEIFNPAVDLNFTDDGTMLPKPERSPGLFYNDLDPMDAAEAVTHLRPMSTAVLDQSPSAIAWKDVPSTYLLTGRDHSTPTVIQRDLSSRADRVIELPESSHSPFLSRPATVADAILAAVRDR